MRMNPVGMRSVRMDPIRPVIYVCREGGLWSPLPFVLCDHWAESQIPCKESTTANTGFWREAQCCLSYSRLRSFSACHHPRTRWAYIFPAFTFFSCKMWTCKRRWGPSRRVQSCSKKPGCSNWKFERTCWPRPIESGNRGPTRHHTNRTQTVHSKNFLGMPRLGPGVDTFDQSAEWTRSLAKQKWVQQKLCPSYIYLCTEIT